MPISASTLRAGEYMIITTRIIHVPGDERSRQFPGHGYPARDEETMSIEFFQTREAFDQAVARMSLDKTARSFGVKIAETYAFKPEIKVAVVTQD